MTAVSVQAVDLSSFVFASNDDIKTTSLLVAAKFQKRHDDVLKKLKSLDCSNDFTARNFAVSEYKDSSGKSNTMYEMTKDGFMFLVMGFTGKAAAQIKEAYINAFNLMHDKLFPKTPYGLKELPVEKISPAQRQEIRHAVAQIAGKDKVAYQTTFWRIHEHFNVNSYKEINACDFDKVMELLGKPQQKMMLVPVDEFEALRNQKPIIKHALLPLETGEVSLLESRYIELIKAEEKLKSVECELLDNEKIIGVSLKNGKHIPIEELAAICNELGNFDYLMMPKKPLLEIKKAMTYIF